MQNTVERDTVSCHDIDQAKAVALQSTSSKNQVMENPLIWALIYYSEVYLHLVTFCMTMVERALDL